MNVFEELRNDVEGIRLLVDWLGDGGKTVSDIHAAHRADACLHGNDGKPCEFNIEAGWWFRNVKDPIAEVIRAQLELKHRLQLHLPKEDSLFMCSRCGCALPTKVWVPIEHIKKHLPKDKLSEYPSFCWIRKEWNDK